MKLRDLNAKLDGTLADGHLSFDCPLGHPHTITVPVGNAPRGWKAEGEFPDTLSLMPSILAHNGAPHNSDLRGTEYDAASLCGWHGFVKNGEAA